ncbi:hypothetical protein KCP73_16615 [Salmonella enterica subsp. enterica]|nr:hypothetical protein KCP73_16615 [Salmonella enterica subsp. enterica]
MSTHAAVMREVSASPWKPSVLLDVLDKQLSSPPVCRGRRGITLLPI